MLGETGSVYWVMGKKGLLIGFLFDSIKIDVANENIVIMLLQSNQFSSMLLNNLLQG